MPLISLGSSWLSFDSTSVRNSLHDSDLDSNNEQNKKKTEQIIFKIETAILFQITK